MSNDPTSTGGAPIETSGQDPEPEKKDTVAYSTYTKVLSEKKKRDEENEALRAKNSALEKAEKLRVEADLKAKEDFKALLALREDELKKRDVELDEIKGSLQHGAKIRAFLDKVNGVVSEQYWKLIDIDSIKMDPNTGMPDALSVEAIAKKFEQEYALVLKSKGDPKHLPNDAANGAGSTKMTVKEWSALKTSKEMKEKQHLVDWST